MAAPTRTHLSDLRGATRMALDAGAGITDIVERMHRTIQVLPLPLGRGRSTRRAASPASCIAAYAAECAWSAADWMRAWPPRWRCCRTAIDTGARRVPVGGQRRLWRLSRAHRQPARDRDEPATSRAPGRSRRPVAAFAAEGDAGPTGKLLVLVHGLCLNDRQWTREGHDHGAALADEFGHTPLYLRYNSGRHIAANGEAFAELLETLVSHWPQPVTELVIVGHSMGGLVARSACHHGATGASTNGSSTCRS